MARILITGSSKGLGRATALELARRGHEVIATARKVETLADLPVAQRLTLDVTSDASVKEAVKAAGHVDVLINNAAEIFLSSVEGAPIDEVKRLYDINVFGSLRMIQAIAPSMRERGAGTIVSISSVVAEMVFPLGAIYASTKWAVEALTDALRTELGHFGVRVIAIEPGSIGTGALDSPRMFFAPNDPYLPLVESQKRPPKEQMTSPEVIAKAVADAVESKDTKLRWPAGDDAIGLLALRAKSDDATFESKLRELLKLTW